MGIKPPELNSFYRCINARGTPDSALNHFVQLFCRTGDRLVQITFMMGDSHGRAALQASFHHATLLVMSTFMTALFAQVHLDPSDLVKVPAQGVFDFGSGPRGERLVSVDVMVSMNLDLHAFLRLC